MKVRMVENVKHNGKRYEIGSIVDDKLLAKYFIDAYYAVVIPEEPTKEQSEEFSKTIKEKKSKK